MLSKLTVHLVTWNGKKYIPYLFDSLRKQTYKDWSLLIIDNHSDDGTVEAIKKELKNFPFDCKIIENNNNVGFAPAHNRAFRETSAEYFLLLNQDMYLMPDCLKIMVGFLDVHSEVAAVAPRLMKWNFNNINPTVKSFDSDGLYKSFSNQIDAVGLKIFRSRRVVEWFAQQQWTGKSGNEFVEVFGVSGAFPMYRRRVIREVVYAGGQIFDETYHSYKEDVDLSWRLAARGCKSYVLLGAAAYHDRAGAGSKKMADRAAIVNKKNQSVQVRYHSYKNHLRTLYKNEYWQNLLLDFPWIFWYELKKFLYFLLFDRKVLGGLKEIWQSRQNLKNKRKEIIKMRRVDWRNFRKWWKK